jgi:hypothetical protein
MGLLAALLFVIRNRMAWVKLGRGALGVGEVPTTTITIPRMVRDEFARLPAPNTILLNWGPSHLGRGVPFGLFLANSLSQTFQKALIKLDAAMRPSPVSSTVAGLFIITRSKLNQ